MAGLTRAVVLGASMAILVGCGGSEPEPNTQYQAGTPMPGQQQPYPGQQQPYPGQQQPYPGQQQPYPGQQQPAPGQQQPVPGQQQPVPGQQQPLPGAIPTAVSPIPNAPVGSPAQQLDASAGAAAQPILNQLATTEAPGAKPVGAAVVGMFQPGQQLETVITMQPGKCYTVIAAGLPTVSEVDIQLVAATPIPNVNPVLAQDPTTGPQAVLGKAPDCYKWALPLAGAVKVITTVTAGQGIAAVQVYEK